MIKIDKFIHLFYDREASTESSLRHLHYWDPSLHRSFLRHQALLTTYLLQLRRIRLPLLLRPLTDGGPVSQAAPKTQTKYFHFSERKEWLILILSMTSAFLASSEI